MRLPGAAMGMAALALAVTGCKAGPVTSIEVTGPGEAVITASAQFDGEAAAAVLKDQATVDDLRANVARLAGSEATITVGDTAVTATADVPASRLDKLSGILGVKSLSSSVSGDTTTVSLAMIQPTQLVEQVKQSVKKRPDAQALSQTMLESGTVTVRISFPGAVSSHTQKGASAGVDGNTVEFTRSLADEGTAQVSASGSTSGTAVAWMWPALAVVLAGLIVAILFLRRRPS